MGVLGPQWSQWESLHTQLRGSSGGFSVDHTSRLRGPGAVPQTGYMVSDPAGEVQTPLHTTTPGTLKDFYHRNQGALSK